MVSFIIPNAEPSSAEESSLFGVSLVFVKSPLVEQPNSNTRIPTNFVCGNAADKETKEDATAAAEATAGFTSPICFVTPGSPDGATATEGENKEPKNTIRQVQVSSDIPILNEKLKSSAWIDQVAKDDYHDSSNPITIGLALVSQRNVILSMRSTLSRLVKDYSRQPSSVDAPISCSALVDILGCFSSKEVETTSLRCILEPYLQAASASWIDRPIADQQHAFETHALRQLTDCLPPIPLALMFATALLEQKIVLSSSRRSVLHSAAVGLGALLKPLKWSHLLVPLVPASLASDLIQYPAPFILGIPSQDSDNMDILGNLPKDVTLVDLDVGRVILAPAFGKDNEMVRKSTDSEATAKALRSQTLYFAQALGIVFGNALTPDTWCCDSPSLVDDVAAGTDKLLSVTHSFIQELLQGAS